MALFSQKELEGLQTSIGTPAAIARILSAIAMVESGPATIVSGVAKVPSDKIGDEELQTTYWGPSIGLWMVRSIKSQSGTGKTRDATRLLDPAFNAKSAKAIYEDQGLNAWSVYTGGQYKAYMQEEFPPPPNTYVVQGGDTLSKIADKFNTTVEILTNLNNLADPNKINIGQHIILPGAIIIPPPPYVPPPFPTGLAPDKSVPSAKPLQQALKDAEYMLETVVASDNYGPKTQDAVVKFHNDNPTFRAAGVTRDVKIGPKGWEHLHRLAYEVNGA